MSGLFKKPKAPALTAQDKELERRQRSELDDLQREENDRLKAIKRGARGRRTLLGSGSELGIQPGLGSAGIRATGTPSRSRSGGGGGGAGRAARVRGGGGSILSSGRKGPGGR